MLMSSSSFIHRNFLFLLLANSETMSPTFFAPLWVKRKESSTLLLTVHQHSFSLYDEDPAKCAQN